MHSEWRQRATVVAGTLLLCLALLHQYWLRRPPYFALPVTVVDHLDRREHHLRKVVLACQEASSYLPSGAEVTCFRPADGKAQDDHDSFLTAVGLLPQHKVLPPFTAAHTNPPEELIEWVIAVEKPFEHPAYEPVAGFPTGYLYRKRP